MVPSCLEGGLESEPHKGRTHSTAGRPLLPSYWSHPIPGGKSGGVWPPFGVRQSGRGLQLSGRGDGRGEITEGVLEPPRRRNPALQLAVSACLLVLWSAGARGWEGVWKGGFSGAD